MWGPGGLRQRRHGTVVLSARERPGVNEPGRPALFPLMEDVMKKPLFAGALALALLVFPALVDAQDALPKLDLSPAQKETIYQSIQNQKHLSNASPPNFVGEVGAVVPETVQTEKLPKTVVELMPQAAGYDYAKVADQVLIVEPKSKRVVAIISE
jgi:hypothetical protein